MKRFTSIALIVLAATMASGCATFKEVDWGRVGAITAVQTVAVSAQVAANEITRDIMYNGRRYGYNIGWRPMIERRVGYATQYQRLMIGRIYSECLDNSDAYSYEWAGLEQYEILQMCYGQAAVTVLGPGILPRGGYYGR